MFTVNVVNNVLGISTFLKSTTAIFLSIRNIFNIFHHLQNSFFWIFGFKTLKCFLHPITKSPFVTYSHNFFLMKPVLKSKSYLNLPVE